MKRTVFLARCLAALALFAAATAHPAFILIESGNNQMARVGTTYAQPWVVNVGPFEEVQFGAFPDDGTTPTVTFGGASSATVIADQFGRAVSPPVIANSVAGAFEGFVSAPGGQVTFDFVNLSPGRTGFLVWPWDVSVPVGRETILPMTGKVVDGDGNPASGVPFTFSTDPSCGSFAGSASFTGTTGSDGLAVSPKFTGVAYNTDCWWYLVFEGAEPAQLQRPITVYPLSGVSMMVTPTSVDAVSGHPFVIKFSFGWSGVAIQVPPGVSIAVSSDRNGATATFKPDPLFLIGSNTFFMEFMPNDQNGNYTITATVAGGPSATIPVRQRKK